MIQSQTDMPTARVRVVGYTYLVDLGPSAQPRFHTVYKQRRCSCQKGETLPLDRPCPAIEAVAEHLRGGGQRAPDPMPSCPICGADTFRDRDWDGKHTKQLGWRCCEGGLSHFLQAKAARIEANQESHPWIFPPADGYPGLRRDEIGDPEFLARCRDRFYKYFQKK